jgi:hypothetical protein
MCALSPRLHAFSRRSLTNYPHDNDNGNTHSPPRLHTSPLHTSHLPPPRQSLLQRTTSRHTHGSLHGFCTLEQCHILDSPVQANTIAICEFITFLFVDNNQRVLARVSLFCLSPPSLREADAIWYVRIFLHVQIPVDFELQNTDSRDCELLLETNSVQRACVDSKRRMRRSRVL